MMDGDPIAGFPDALVDALRARRGRPLFAAPLSGMSGAGVWRVRGEHGTAVVKRATDPREVRFYTRVAPELRARGVGIPGLLAAHADERGHWLALEDLPAPLPRERWLADPDVLAHLARLHATPWSALAEAGDPGTWFRARSTPAMARVVASFPPPARTQLGERIARGDLLFAGDFPVSGDPNPRNWGVRAAGGLALFDWERFGAGHPAFDLAITVPGSGSAEDFARVAEAYAALAPAGVPAPTAREMVLAKAWVMAEFLSWEYTSGGVDRALIATLRAALPAWLARTESLSR